MHAEIIHTQWDNRDALVLRAGRYEAMAVPSLGANVLQLIYHHPCGAKMDILRTPACAQALLDDPYAYGIPVLFPANRIAGGEYSYDGVTYRFPQNYPNGVHIHGVVHNRPWAVEETAVCGEEARVVFALSTRDASLRAHFPIDLVLRLECVLNKNGLLQRFILQNESNVTMPFGLAYHTAFRIPFVQGGKAQDVRLHIPLEGLCADDPVDRLPSGHVRPLSRYEAGFTAQPGENPLKEPLDALYKAQSGSGQAVLRDNATGLEVVYDADAQDLYWIIWNGDAKSGFVAIEPQTWLSNAVHLPHPEQHGVLYAPPHTAWKCETRIYAR